MNSIKIIKKRYWLSVAMLSAASLMILVAPAVVAPSSGILSWSGYMVAAMFWGFAILGYGAIIAANRERKDFLKKKFGRDIQVNYRPGAMCFFSCLFAKIVDILMFVSFLLVCVALGTPMRDTYLVIILLMVLFWAVNMHCLFNGRIFRITKYKVQERK